MLLASGFCCAEAAFAALVISAASTTMVRIIGLPLSGLLILAPLAQRLQIGAHPRGIGAEIAGADARGGTNIDPAPRVGHGDADHDIVGEAEPAGAIAGLDAARARVGLDDGPAQPPRRRQGPAERLGPRQAKRHP